MSDELTMNGNKMTMEEVIYFVREQYPTIINSDEGVPCYKTREPLE